MTNNKLIAEFMGRNVITEDDIRANKNPISTSHDGDLEEDLEYHSSWDWLMPVIDKISGIKNWSINATLEWLSASEFNIQQESDGFYTIEDVYLAVVEFIKLTNLKQQ